MQTHELMVTGRDVSLSFSDGKIVRTSAGMDRVHALFDSDEWLSFEVTCTFGSPSRTISVPIVITSVRGSDEWSAEAYCNIPWEVLRKTGRLRVTFQGTDSSGNHIITAKGAPLTVEEAGDVALGDIPEDAPTVDQWNQAYSDAMAAINQLASAISEIGDALTPDDVSDIVRREIGTRLSEELLPATVERLGVVQIGDGLDVTGRGVISVSPKATPIATVDSAGVVLPDGDTITVDADGRIHGSREYVLQQATRDSLGGIKVDGSAASVSDDGTLEIVALSIEEIDRLTPLDPFVFVGDVEY